MILNTITYNDLMLFCYSCGIKVCRTVQRTVIILYRSCKCYVINYISTDSFTEVWDFIECTLQ